MRGLHRWVLAAAGAGLFSAAASAAESAEAPPPRQRVVTMTRFMKVFSEHEYNLIDAVRAGDRAMLDRLLPEDFEQRNAASPGSPVPRAEWLQANELKAPGQALISELAVHDRGELAIASFRLKLAERELFIVDVWRRKGADAYELLTRYAAPVPGRAPAPAKPDTRQ